MLDIEYPYPPTVNTYWRTAVKGKRAITYVSTRGKKYSHDVINLTKASRANLNTDKPLEVTVLVYPPDKRKRDIDNILKALLDSMQKANVYQDDSQICKLTVTRCEIIKHGKVSVSIKEAA
jgi:crossover junction endodeoxyribonuclease RusA